MNVGWLGILGSFALAWASLGTGPAVGRFRPVPLILGLFLAYNALPFAVVRLFPALARSMLFSTYDYYSADTLETISRLVFVCTLAAYGGQMLAAMVHERTRQMSVLAGTPTSAPEPVLPVDTVFVAGTFTVLMIGALGLMWQLRAFFFAGYHEGFGEDLSEVLLRGTLSSVFSLLFINYVFLWHAGSNWRTNRRQRQAEHALTATVVVMVGGLLMSMGGRLYIASAALTLIALRLALGSPKIADEKPARSPSRWRALLVVAVLVAGASLVGIWRSQGTVSAEAVLGNLLAEPLFVSISLTSLVHSNTLPVVEFPSFLLGDWVGLLPSSIYPEKIDRFFAVFQAYDMESPVGGLNGLATLLVNFGWLGTIGFFAAMGFGLTFLAGTVAHGDRTGTRRLIFVVATTFPIFSLWRDPPVIAVYKNLVQNALFWPWLLAAIVGVRTLLPARDRVWRARPGG